MSQNSREYWNNVWQREGIETWRSTSRVNQKIANKLLIDDSVLDLGCGNGAFLSILKNINPERKLWGADRSNIAIQQMLTQRGINGITSDFPPLDNIMMKHQLLTGCREGFHFDWITCLHTLEHIPDDILLIKETALYTNNLIIVVPDDSLGPAVHPEHERAYTEKTLRLKLKMAYTNVTITREDDIYDHPDGEIKTSVLVAWCNK